MDAHSFRCMAEELIRLLDGARVEKIYAPSDGALVFAVYASGAKYRLVLRPHRASPLFFLAATAPSALSRPSAHVMRLRKYVRGRRLGRGVQDFVMRRLAFPVMAAQEATPWYLLLDLREGARVVPVLPDDFAREPAWPPVDVVDSLCDREWSKHGMETSWQAYALLTPLLRETLAALEPMEGRALMTDLEAGGTELFAYTSSNAAPPVLYAAWPLPDPLLERRGLRPLAGVSHAGESSAAPERSFADAFPVLHLVSRVDEPLFFHDLAMDAKKTELEPVKRADKRLRRLDAKLEQEERRLRGMLAMRADALLLQEHLWRFSPEERLADVCLPAPEGSGDKGSEPCRVTLDARRTVRENMTRMFHQSRRGERGLALLAERRKNLVVEREALGTVVHGDRVMAPEAARENAVGERDNRPHAAGKAGNVPVEREEKSIRDVAVFSSSDGYVLLRGKNARGNQSLLKIGSPHDLWLHAEDGPSAHLIIRRAHAADEVPESTLREAAVLVGLRSWQRHDARARIMVAELRHVRAIKGAAPGTVRVDTVLRSLVVALAEG